MWCETYVDGVIVSKVTAHELACCITITLSYFAQKEEVQACAAPMGAHKDQRPA